MKMKAKYILVIGIVIIIALGILVALRKPRSTDITGLTFEQLCIKNSDQWMVMEPWRSGKRASSQECAGCMIADNHFCTADEYIDYIKSLPSIARSSGTQIMGQRLSAMGLTIFDKELAKQFMDKNGDGQCDVCGMNIKLCMDSGQMQCNMDSKSTIGVLGSQHIHTDWKIYINGKPLDNSFFEPISMDMSKMDSKTTSSFIHLDKGAPAPEKTGNLLHMHATGVPLWIFFESVGIKFNKDCLILNDAERFCSNNKDTLKFYVNGKPNSQWENYVFNDLDKILISYGDETDVTQQLSSITNFAKNH